jgi:hypothetical protein
MDTYTVLKWSMSSGGFEQLVEHDGTVVLSER